jgi:gamma-glutamylcyclotransferase
MLYFAYGSNMQWSRIRDRCPSVNYVCKALLPDYRLTFSRRYSRDNSSWTASIEEAPGAHAWGVVYEIDDRDIDSLNRAEGYMPGRANDKNAHLPFQCHVLCEGVKDRALSAMTYIANVEGSPPPEHRDRRVPSKEYKGRLVEGAQHWRLPETYIRRLSSIEAVE